ncbi:MAG: HAD family hydrolase [Tissierellia bacterium]|nr:HAD family hydrolase [Tissierellia bacterium]
MSKLFVTDLDGTLLNSKHKISDKNLKALYRLKEEGYDIAFCSGRVLESVKKIGQKAGIKPYYIANNGAVVASEDEIIFEKPIAHDKLSYIIDETLKRNYDFHMYDLDTYYSNRCDKKRLSHLRIEGTDKYQINIICREDILDYILDKQIPIYKIMIHLNFANDLEFKKILENYGGLYLAMSGAKAGDVMSLGVSKALGIEKLISFLDRDYEKIVCIGDHENDIPMLEMADFAIAMGNAIEKTKKTSDWVTKSNDQDGFYYAVMHLLEGERK